MQLHASPAAVAAGVLRALLTMLIVTPPSLLRVPVRAVLRWPVSAVVCWMLAWGGMWAVAALWPMVSPWAPVSAGVAVVVSGACWAGSLWRAGLLTVGFGLSLWLMAGMGSIVGGAWPWALAAGALAVLYPWRTWRDAPWFPTRAGALAGLPAALSLPATARILDVGCGAGDGLCEWRRVLPQAQLRGVEWSRPLAWLARWRCPGATIQMGDMWAVSWRDVDVVYLFQRPETMPRAVAKALAEMRPRAWLVSLEFEAPSLPVHAVLRGCGQRPVWIYRVSAGRRRVAQR